MEERDLIQKAINYLESLKNEGGVVENIEIKYNHRSSDVFDKNDFKFKETNPSNNRFIMTIHGRFNN